MKTAEQGNVNRDAKGSTGHLGFVSVAVFLLLTLSAGPSPAAKGDCGQPITDGFGPVATDCLAILQTGVGNPVCTHECLCDTDGSGSVVATDALDCLRNAVGQDVPLVCTQCGVPVLEGLDPAKAEVLPITVQAAHNDDTMFFHMSWQGDRGDTHDYLHFTNGAWQNEGAPRRETQSTIDNDPLRGPTNRTTNIYESRLTFMLDDPTGPNAVTGFGELGCFMTCHNNSRAMPLWDPATDFTKYLTDTTPGSLDLWHRRLHRANPLGASDDQFVSRIPVGGEAGGRIRDAGTGPFQTGSIGQDGNPAFAFDPTTTGGRFAFPFVGVFTDPLRFFRDATSAELGGRVLAVGIDYSTAVTMGYVPQEGDAIPRRRLRTPTGSAGDITGFGTDFTPSPSDPLMGRWDVGTQRLLDTGNGDDTALAQGGVYNIAFAVHAGRVTVRDHYIGFPMKLSIGGAAGDINSVQIAGSGRSTLPDFTDTATFPVTDVDLFLPGINSFSFLTGADTAEVFIDPQNGLAVDQNHAGANALLTQGLGCRDCHTVTAAETFNPPQAGGFFAGAMETLAVQRGGVSTPTPLPVVVTTTTMSGTTTTMTTTTTMSTTTTTMGGGNIAAGTADYDARCAFCHAAGAHDTSAEFANDLAQLGAALVADLGTIDGSMTGLLMSPTELLDMDAFLSSL